MALKAKRILTMADQKSKAELARERANYDDAQARKLGYPSANVLRLSDRLSEVAGAWRETEDEQYIVMYEETLRQMVEGGYDLNTLPIQDQLPRSQMPEWVYDRSTSEETI